ncbi:putative ribonuclease H protein [Nymphaea thermarum]|nr:putative ribonuclease H protein [Nymphaea thermarum]
MEGTILLTIPFMKILNWNIRGLVRKEAQRAVFNSLHEKSSDIVFLLDSMLSGNHIANFFNRHGKYNFVSNHDQADGRARVIAGWNPTTIRVVDIILCRDWIGLIANERNRSQNFATFGVYLHPHRSTRQAALQTLSTSLRNLVLPIAVIGDFNAVRDSNDKSGRAPNSSSCNDFNQFIVDNNLSIVEDPQRHFTWSNNRRNSATILCKLDWAMVNVDWVLHVGDQNSLQILPRCTSDHSALVLCSVKASYRNPLRGQFKFKFLKNWSLRGIMGEFEMKAGMKVNDAKSRMVTFNVKEDLNNLAVASTGWPLASLPLNYLGLPLFVGKFRPDLCQPLITKAQRKLAAWKASLLSYAGRLCLLQSSFMPLIFFWCPLLKLPKKIIQVLESLAANFLWVSNLGRRKQHLVAWNKLCRPKGEGGVGLKSIKDLNRACLGNLALQVGHTTSSWASLASQKYLSNHSLWTRKSKAKDSWLWRGIEWGWDTIKKEVRWSVGNGATACVWLDEWGEGILLFKVPSFEFYTLATMRALSVAELKLAIQHNFDAVWLRMFVII